MSFINRIIVMPKDLSGNEKLKKSLNQCSRYQIESIIFGKVYLIKTSKMVSPSTIQKLASEVFYDEIDEQVFIGDMINFNEDFKFDYYSQISFRPGVTDNPAKASEEAVRCIRSWENENFSIASGVAYFIRTKASYDDVQNLLKEEFYNDLIQHNQLYTSAEFYTHYGLNDDFPTVNVKAAELEYFEIEDSSLCLDRLLKHSEEKFWALSKEELEQIIKQYTNHDHERLRNEYGLKKDITDVEIEIIAQTWSEHCKHKIFNSHIEYEENVPQGYPKIANKMIGSLFKNYIKGATEQIIEENNIDWTVSLFTDNAGIVRYDENIDYCLKVETHNSPSALDPYGGALTGILGVNRDIMGCGTGALPIANSNVLCFGRPDYNQEELNQLPPRLKNPKTILKGVHKGIEDGGNKSGIPTINGSMYFHDNFSGKPLVYCGTIGVMPQKINQLETAKKYHRPGDLIIMAGGAVGIDGIHGATFSSLELKDTAPATAVQIGDPLTQKKLMDFLMIAQSLGLYNSITDNGAGGLSSSVGEMAEHCNGAKIYLDKVPTKYPGLAPYEIIISESQERMTLSVDPKHFDEISKLAKKYNVELTNIGEFTDSSFFEIYHHEKTVALLNLDFLHESLIPMQLKANWDGPREENSWIERKTFDSASDLETKIKTILSSLNVASKEGLVRQYDHEVKGMTIVKPFIEDKLSGPSDAGVIWPKNYGGSKDKALAFSNALCPQYSAIDPYYMGQMAVDEAVRNLIATGANPEKIALCDNFCWPDPVESEKNPDGAYKLGQLVRTCEGMKAAALKYKAPFISGKDSMKNDFHGKDRNGNQIKISISPTLLISAIAPIEDLNHKTSTNIKNIGDHIFLLGKSSKERTFSEFTQLFYPKEKKLAEFDLDANVNIYQTLYQGIQKGLINSCHDVSDGGTITSLLESLFPMELGIQLEISNELKTQQELEAFFFNEEAGKFIVSVSEENLSRLEKLTENLETTYLGKANDSGLLEFNHNDRDIKLSIKELHEAWSVL